MTNEKIAINWAITQTNSTSGFVYSDQFFKPFSNINIRKRIIAELYKNKVIAWADTDTGAYLFKKDDPRLQIHTIDHIKGGIWKEGNNILILPCLIDHCIPYPH